MPANSIHCVAASANPMTTYCDWQGVRASNWQSRRCCPKRALLSDVQAQPMNSVSRQACEPRFDTNVQTSLTFRFRHGQSVAKRKHSRRGCEQRFTKWTGGNIRRSAKQISFPLFWRSMSLEPSQVNVPSIDGYAYTLADPW